MSSPFSQKKEQEKAAAAAAAAAAEENFDMNNFTFGFGLELKQADDTKRDTQKPSNVFGFE